MKKTIALFAFVTILQTGWTQQVSYDALTISEKLKTGANTVKRFEERIFEVLDIDRAKLKVHVIYTVLNKEGADCLNFSQMTNKYRSLDDVDIRLFDSFGREMNRYKKKDLIKQAKYAEMVEDGMYHFLNITAPSFPVTIDINYELGYTGTLFYPAYIIQEANEGVEQSSLIVKVPKELGFRFKEKNIDLKPQIREEGKNMVYSWSVKELAPFKYEMGAVEEFYFCPLILLAPNKFRFYNTNGDLSSWKSFGEWEQSLFKDLEILPEEKKAFFSDMVKDAKTDNEKIAIIYHYLQENFRYVSIQLGIGGFRPFPAKFTDDKKYGDCKALSFYMYSVLKILGIKSYVALINAEYNNPPVDPDFPSSQFNHMILCIPQKNDSLWLECTSKTTAFNYLGSFTENRNALLITEKGGVLVPTPRSDPKDNVMNVITHIELKEDGSGETKSEMQTKGLYNELLVEVESSKKEDQKEYIIKLLGFKQPDEFSITKRKNGNDLTEINLEIEKIPQFTAGSKMFLNPRIYSFLSGKMPESENRKHDYYFQSCFQKTDTTVYHLPEGYLVEVLPANADKKCTYASYQTSYSFNKETNELTTVAKLVLNQNRIPPEKYAEVKGFFDQVYSDNTQKLVIKKN